jgi:hypothetical protein
MGKGLIIFLVILFILVAIITGGYFLIFAEKCPEGELFNPYSNMCVNKNVFCNLNSECTLLEGQSASFPGETLVFTLVSATEGQGEDSAIINIDGREVNFAYIGPVFSFGKYSIGFESADGDADKIMGASFEVIKTD